jgi:hypothetical protein
MINNDKQTIYEALVAIGGFTVYQGRPVSDMALPCATFTLSDMSIDVNLDRELVNQSTEYTIDIFAKSTSEVSDILASVEAVMRGMSYVLTSALDLPDPDNIAHTQARFNLS